MTQEKWARVQPWLMRADANRWHETTSVMSQKAADGIEGIKLQFSSLHTQRQGNQRWLTAGTASPAKVHLEARS